MEQGVDVVSIVSQSHGNKFPMGGGVPLLNLACATTKTDQVLSSYFTCPLAGGFHSSSEA